MSCSSTTPPALGPAASGATLLVLALALSGCEREDRQAAGPGPSADAQAALPNEPGPRVPASEVELSTLFQDRLPAPTAWLEDNLRRRNPGVDGWPTEVLQDLASESLQTLLDALRREDTAGALAACHGEFEGLTALLPSELREDLDSYGWIARRPLELSSVRHPADELPALWGALVDGYLPASLQATHEIISIRIVPSPTDMPGTDTTGSDTTGSDTTGADTTGARFATRALVQLAGRDQAERPRQQNLTLDLQWQLVAGSSPSSGQRAQDRARLVSLTLADYSDARLSARPLVDVTRAALGNVPAFESELELGMESYQMAWDRVFGAEYLGMHGVSVGDVDGDGLEDLYVCQLGGLTNRLYLRQPDGSFADRSQESGLAIIDNTRSALILDFDDDGHRDLALAIESFVLVCYNAGDGSFPRDEQHRRWLASPTPEAIYSLSAADPDLDGDLDIYTTRYVAGGVAGGFPTPYYNAKNGAPNTFFRNEGSRDWSDATSSTGLDQNNDRFSLASVWEDFDDDGDPDLYVTNDFGRNNYYRNDGSGVFIDVAEESGMSDQASGMGATVSDYDLDGDLDVYVSNMFSSAGLRIASQPETYMQGQNTEVHEHFMFHARGNTLLANRGDGTFEDVTESSGAALGYWAWGALFFDLQNDGYDDIYVPNGFVTNPADAEDLGSFFWRRVTSQSPTGDEPTESYKNAWSSISYMVQYGRKSWNAREPNCVYLNTEDGRFVDISAASGVGYRDDSRSVAALDWNDDGRQDLVLRSRTSPRLRLLENRVPDAGHFLTVTLAQPETNRDAIGAKLFVETPERTYRRTLRAGEGFLAQSSLRAFFGLADAERADLRVVWPDGHEQRWSNVALDRHLWIMRGAEPAERKPLLRSRAPLTAVDLEPRHPGSQRLVLGHKLPIKPLSLPGFAQPDRKVEDLAGRVVLLHLWEPSSEAARRELAQLAARRAELEAAGLIVVPVCTASAGPELAKARRLMAELGFSDVGGYADGSVLRDLEALYLEVLGNFDRVPMPSSLLLDRAGQLVAMYLGTLDLDGLVADAAVVAQMSTQFGFNGRLAGGRWELRRSRSFEELGSVFESFGRPELAQLYFSLVPSDAPPEAPGEEQ